MFGRILYISDNTAYIENKGADSFNGDLLNLHLIFEHDGQKILGEINEVKEDRIQINFLGEFIDGKFNNGLLRKASLNSTIRIINNEELIELIGQESKTNFALGQCATYKNFKVCPNINSLFSNHLCIFGNSGSGKSCGVARIIQNILSNPNALTYNANLIFFDSFGEYKNAFKSINSINSYYNYKFITSNIKDEDDVLIEIPVNLLTVDDLAVLLNADKHSQLTIIERALKYAKIFSIQNEEAKRFKNNLIAKAILSVLYNTESSRKKKDDIFSIIEACHTDEFNFNTIIEGIGYTRVFSECFEIDSKGHFGEETLITDYILKFIDDKLDDYEVIEECYFTMKELEKALEFTLISEGFNQNQNMHDDAQILKVRLNTILHNGVHKFFNGNEYISISKFITKLVSLNEKKCQIININLESLDDSYAKAIVKIYSRILFEFAHSNANRATIPFHLFLEEAHRYIQKDTDTYLLGYNIFDRIAKEGRKYGILVNIISQRPVEISDTVVSQCSNFLIFKMTHPLDIKYIEEMLPNISEDVISKMKILQPGTCVAFGSAFKIPMICKLEMPNPRPYSSSCDVSAYWDSDLKNLDELTTDTNEVKEINYNVTNAGVISTINSELLDNL